MNSFARQAMRRFRAFALALLLFSPTTAIADPVVVTGGFISMYQGDLGGFALEGDEFSLGVAFGFTGGPAWTRLVPGEPLTLTFDVNPSGFAFAHVPGFSTAPGEFVRLGGSLQFVGPTFVPEDPGTLFAFFSSPVTMSGVVTGHAQFGTREDPPLFTLHVTGSGITTAGPFRRFDDHDPVDYVNVQGTHGVTFSSPDVPAPIPEPATVALLATGMAAVGSRRVRVRRRV